MSDHSVKMTYVKAEEARRLFREGMKVPELCERFNLSERAMRALIKGDSWKPKPQKSPKPSKKSKNNHQPAKNKWDDVYKLWRDGKTNAEIAQALEISNSYITLIQWAIRCARKDPGWAEAQKDKKNRKMAEWADSTVRREITKEDWKYVACELAKRNHKLRETMTLSDILKHVIHGTKLLVLVELDVGTKENFTVEIMRGQRFGGWRQEYTDWLEALNLEVDHISACTEDTDNNRDMLSIFCKPIKVLTQEDEDGEP